MVFGGRERMLRLRAFFIRLKQNGHKLFVASRGFYFVIEHLLGRLLAVPSNQVFVKMFANAPSNYAENGLTPEGKRGVIKRIITQNMQGKSFVFVDDDLNGEVVPVATAFQSQVADGTALMIHIHPPEGPGVLGGMSIALLDEIERHISLPTELANSVKTSADDDASQMGAGAK
jgi:hypothetical protein